MAISRQYFSNKLSLSKDIKSKANIINITGPSPDSCIIERLIEAKEERAIELRSMHSTTQ
jgi:hypothetical protein